MLEVEPAHLGERVHEAVEGPRRLGREEEEHGLGTEMREETGPADPVVRGVAPPVEEHEPADGQASR